MFFVQEWPSAQLRSQASQVHPLGPLRQLQVPLVTNNTPWALIRSHLWETLE